MYFNVKAYNYGDEVQLRLYSSPIEVSDSDEDRNELIKDINSYKREVKHADELLDKISPWGDFVLTDLTPEDIAYRDMCHEHSVNSSLGRTVNRLYEYARANEWQYFFTFTLDGDKVDRYDYDACLKVVSKFFSNVRNRGSPDIKYIIVPEMHVHGQKNAAGQFAWHFHALVSDIGSLQLVQAVNNKKTYKGQKNKHYGEPLFDAVGRPIYNIKSFKSGFSTVTEITDTGRASSYVTKYITKDLVDRLPYKRRFIPSLNLNRPDVFRFCYDFHEDSDMAESINKIKDLFSKDVTHIKTMCVTNGLYKNQVHYVELK